jgi:hypothetical protein
LRTCVRGLLGGYLTKLPLHRPCRHLEPAEPSVRRFPFTSARGRLPSPWTTDLGVPLQHQPGRSTVPRVQRRNLVLPRSASGSTNAPQWPAHSASDPTTTTSAFASTAPRVAASGSTRTSGCSVHFASGRECTNSPSTANLQIRHDADAHAGPAYGPLMSPAPPEFLVGGRWRHPITLHVDIAKPSVSVSRSRLCRYREAVCVDIAKPSVSVSRSRPISISRSTLTFGSFSASTSASRSRYG